MPAIPLVWIGGGIVAALGLGGYSLGKEVGEKFGKTVPWIVGGAAVYLAHKASK